MIPYFYVDIPNKGAIFGPFIKLPSNLQKKLVNVIYYFPSINEKFFKSLLACCKSNNKRLFFIFKEKKFYLL